MPGRKNCGLSVEHGGCVLAGDRLRSPAPCNAQSATLNRTRHVTSCETKTARADCVLAGSRPRQGARSCQACRIEWADRNARKRRKVLEHYGLVCKCCGEDTYELLEIDHVDGDGTGNDHRREIGAGQTYDWLIRNGFPPGFQTLCSNCNRAKFRYGVCPHQRKRAEEKTT